MSSVPALTSVASVASSAVGMFSSTELLSVAISMDQKNVENLIIKNSLAVLKTARTRYLKLKRTAVITSHNPVFICHLKKIRSEKPKL